MTRLEYLRALYHVLLGREPESAGLTYWANFLKQSGDPKEVLAQMLDSEEYLRRNPQQRSRPDPRRIAALAKHLAPGRKLTIVDVGAQELDYEDPIYLPLLQSGIPCRVIGFDPLGEPQGEGVDPEKSQDVTLLPYAIGDGNRHTLHVTSVDTNSSFYPLNEDFVRRYGDLSSQHTVRTEEIATRRLDDVLDCEVVDFLKLDIQGYELPALESARQTLARTAVVHCEVEFAPIYEGQPLFGDVQAFMVKQGFHLVDLIHPVRLPLIVPSGQVHEDTLLFADAVFFRDAPAGDQELRIAQALIASLIYRKHGLAESLLQQCDEVSGTHLAEILADRLHSEQEDHSAQLREENEALRERASALEGEQNALREELGKVQSDLATSQSEFAALSSDAGQLRQEVTAAKDEIARLAHELVTASEANAQARNQLAAMDRELAAAKHLNEDLARKADVSETHLEALRQQLAESDQTIHRMSREQLELVAALRTSRIKVETAEGQMRTVLNSRSFRWLAPARKLKAMLLPPRR